MLQITGYFFLFIASYLFSMWMWNKCLAISGKMGKDTTLGDLLFAIAIPLGVLSVRLIFGN